MHRYERLSFSIIGAFALAAALTFSSSEALGSGASSTIYRCTAKDAVGIEPDGTLSKQDPGADIKRKEFWRIVIDVHSGDVSFPEAGKLETQVVQRADASGDYVLFPKYAFRRNKTAANATTDFIRLHVGGDKEPVTFRAYSLTYLVTGGCEVVP